MKPFFVLTLWMLSYAAMLRAENYVIDPDHTLPVFEVNHLGFSTQRGRFDRTSGSMKLDPQKRTGSVELMIDAASINMGQKKWDDHMKSSDFFNTENFQLLSTVPIRLSLRVVSLSLLSAHLLCWVSAKRLRSTFSTLAVV